jgi:hypothetical protein
MYSWGWGIGDGCWVISGVTVLPRCWFSIAMG